MSRLIKQARALAHALHANQRRADGSPYIQHPRRVATLVEVTGGSEDMIAAAWLHDIYEDTSLRPPALTEQFGATVGDLVEELTNVYTKESYPHMNRANRKAAEFERLANVTWSAQFIKLCDRIDNLQTIEAKGVGFTRLYCDESMRLVAAVTAATSLQRIVVNLVKEIRGE